MIIIQSPVRQIESVDKLVDMWLEQLICLIYSIVVETAKGEGDKDSIDDDVVDDRNAQPFSNAAHFYLI